MGLSALSSSIRRRLVPLSTRSGKPPPRSSSSAPPNKPKPPRPALRRVRAKDCSASELIDALSSITSLPPPDYVTALSDRLTSDVSLFTDFLRPLSDPSYPSSSSDPTAPPRVRFHSAWVVSTFLRHGPPPLRASLAEHPPHLRALLSVFSVKPGALDPTLATMVTDVLRAVLHSHPRQVATAFSASGVIQSLLTHIALSPVADLLPRLVGSRPFPSGPVFPSHKRAVFALASVHCHDVLATSAMTAIGNSDVSLLCTALSTMTEIATRAAVLARRAEEPDERTDATFAPSVGVVTASAFNDARTELDLLVRPAALLAVLDAVLQDAAGDADMLEPALHACAHVLAGARASRTLDVIKPDSTPFGLALAKFVPALAVLLNDDNGKVGRVRLAVLDVMHEMCLTLSDEALRAVIVKERFVSFKALLVFAQRVHFNDMVTVRVGQILAALFDRADAKLVNEIIRHTRAIHMVWNLRDKMPLPSCVVAAAHWAGDESALADVGDEQVQMLRDIADAVAAEDERASTGSFGSVARAGLQKSGGRPSVTAESAPSEDFGQDLYMVGLLNDAARGCHKTPPTDGVVNTVEAVAKGWGHELGSLLRNGHQGGGKKRNK